MQEDKSRGGVFCLEVESICKDLKNYTSITKVVNIIVPFFLFSPLYFMDEKMNLCTYVQKVLINGRGHIDPYILLLQ